jgi:hypothetical protein
MLLEDGRGEGALALRRLGERSGGGVEVEVALRRVVDLLQRVQELVSVEPDRAHPQEVRVGVLDSRRDRPEVTGAELELEEQHLAETPLLRDLASPQRQEVHRRELVRHDRDRLGRLRRRRQRVEEAVRNGLTRLRSHRPRREVTLVLCEVRDAEGVVD